MKKILFILLLLLNVRYAEAQITQQYIQFIYTGSQDKPITSVIFSTKKPVETFTENHMTPIIFVVSEFDFSKLITVIKSEKKSRKIPYISQDTFPGLFSFILITSKEKSMYGFGDKEIKLVFKNLVSSIKPPILRSEVKETLEMILYRCGVR